MMNKRRGNICDDKSLLMSYLYDECSQDERERAQHAEHGEHRRRRRSGCRICCCHSTQRPVGDSDCGPRTLVPCRLCPACGRESQPGRRHAGRP